MNKTFLAIALISLSATALADSHGKPGWDNWVQTATADAGRPARGTAPTPPAVTQVPAGSASYTGATVATVSDSSSGSLVRSISTGAVALNVTFSGTGTTTETGTITGLTGTGATIGDLAFSGSGTGGKFNGTVTSTTYAAVAATSTTPATGTGKINGELSKPVVVSSVVSAPLSASGAWNFAATTTLGVKGTFAAVR